MAKKRITNISSGTYNTETDLTIVQQNAGSFAGAILGLMEKGPAFQIMTSADFDERRLRMGNLNPSFKTSYSAYEFLEQANNLKEVRILGLEGYNEDVASGGYDKAFAIMYNLAGVEPAGTLLEINDITTNGTTTVVITADAQTVGDNAFVTGDYVVLAGITGVTSANGQFIAANVVNTPGVSVVFEITVGAIVAVGAWTGGGTVQPRKPLVAAAETVVCILKPRRTSFTLYAEVDYVQLSATTQSDLTTACTDDLFLMTIYFKGNQTTYPPMIVKCSLRPTSNQYIAKIFGTDPRDTTKLQGGVPPLWVEFIYPSVAHKIVTTTTAGIGTGYSGYYYPGDTPVIGGLGYDNDRGYLTLATGNITIQENFSYPSFVVLSATPGANIIIETTTDHGLNVNDPVTLVNINGILVGTVSVNGNWYVKATPSGTTFTIKDAEGNTPVTSGSYIGGGTIKKTFTPTWEREVMDLGGAVGTEVEFQTPITPWFVSDFDENGETKRLFRIWSISDGEAANTEIKIEVSNINPDGNLLKGSFDIIVRANSDTDDKEKVVYESFSNLTMDSTSSNYILRRIGDGEQFELQSSFIFVELNEDDVLPDTSLPYGVEGIPSINGIKAPDVMWATSYDLAKPTTRQYLGLPNNSINMMKAITPDNLSFKNLISYDAAVGLGFHLNPQMISTGTLYTIVSASFKLAEPKAYYTSTTSTTPVTGLDKVKRSKYVVNIFGGFDGFNVYKQREWDITTSKDYEALEDAIKLLNDAESLEADFSVIITPDINFEMHPNATELILEMCGENGRGDALFIFDFDYGYISGSYPEINPTSAKIALQGSNMLSSFAATYYPDWQFKDEVNNINPWIPPSVLAFATIAATATNENVYQPPAGSLRTVTENLVRTRQRMKLPDREILKSANINPITLFPGSGYEITESRTTQEVLSARSFIHNRLLLGYAKKALNQSLRPILHQLNTGKALKDLMLDAIEPIFARIKREQGLEDFKITITDDPNDRTTLYGKIEIVPLYPVERIILEFSLVNGSLNFNTQ